MLTDILAADDRLFAKLGGNAADPVAVYGVGYDADDDGNFTLDDGTSFNAAGIAITSPADLAIAADQGDYYAEGWYTGFWHYGMAASNPFDGGQWADAPQGMAGRALADGAWDSWTYSPTFSFASFADNPQAAASPYPLGDFNRDGEVNGTDYSHWKHQFGSAIDPSADGNRNGIVDAADYTVWRNQVAAMTSAAASVQTFDVPEPNGLTIALIALSFVSLVAQRRRRLAGGASLRYTRNAVPKGRHENSPGIYRWVMSPRVLKVP
jgi:hypothetical protein